MKEDYEINGGGMAQRGRTLRRGKTLNRPERHQEIEPMIHHKEKQFDIWVLFSKIVTFWAPGFLLNKMGMHDKQVRQAWREKFALCFIIGCICTLVVFLTLFLPSTFCDADQRSMSLDYRPVSQMTPQTYIINGNVFNSTGGGKLPTNFPNFEGFKQLPNVNYLFKQPQFKECQGLKFQANSFDPCTTQNDPLSGCPFPDIKSVEDEYGLMNTKLRAGFDWDNLIKNYFVLEGYVLDLSPYMKAFPDPVANDDLDVVIRKVVNGQIDATRAFLRTSDLKKSINCMVKKYNAGQLSKSTAGCFAVDFFMSLSLFVILSIICIRFFMAAIFHWFLSSRLSTTPKKIYPQNMHTQVANNSKPWERENHSKSLVSSNQNELFTVLLVTAYSEGELSMRTTIESLAGTDYSDDKKLLFIVCDGIITGSGNDKSTPDIVLDMLEIEPQYKNVEPKAYIAVADGSKQLNMAKVIPGKFPYKNRKVPTLLVIKCGGPLEQGKPKPGNRGKRDSQLILMNFFSRVIYNERMTPLDYDLFTKIKEMMHVTPDYFETVLMVDADTKVYPDSLKLLTNCLINDTQIMGLCGETKIANKRDSWVTAIQVFEYYISHHLGKGFEAVFGGVTCLPGCFCMYRLKAPKGETDWVPIITKPEIVQEYSQNIVETLHQKNLLLLGEDRFLTTLMLRNFPNRKMMFVPQAICKTVVPDEFSVLLSQRRRWINSTIHNLLELVLVRNLCGTFCFSMQFVIFMELLGTIVLPVAIFMTYVLIVGLFLNPITSFATSAPLIMLIAVLFSPAILILITTRKMIYVLWMFVYLIFLPIWNFVLPVYSYWHFDDFSWGATRQVDGEVKGDSHGRKSGDFDSAMVPLKRWEDYERKRRRSIKRKERERAEPILGDDVSF